jgi:hypothetical protein
MMIYMGSMKRWSEKICIKGWDENTDPLTLTLSPGLGLATRARGTAI